MWRQAAVVGDRVIYFGSNCKEKTYILEQVGEELKVVGEEEGFDFRWGSDDDSFTSYKDTLYCFPKNIYDEVHSFSLEGRQWIKHS